jgi:hypothetical protein
MSKLDFIKAFNNACKLLNVDIDPSFEHGLKISKDFINTDRVNISFSKSKINKHDLLVLINKVFDKNDDIIDFVNNIYITNENKIQNIFLGYSLGKPEVYFELFEEGESSVIVSYDEKRNEYIPIENITYVTKTLCDIINQKTKLLVTEPDLLFKGGFVKNEDIYYLLVLEPMDSIRSILQILCNNINPDEQDTIAEWFNNNDNKIVSHIAYSINNEEITLNIYTNESRTS